MTKSRYILFLLALLAGALTGVCRTIDEVPNVHVDNRTRYVSDPDNYLSAAAIARADSILGATWAASTAEPVAVIVKDLSGGNIDDYATDLFEAWGIGKSDTDNGLLILISVDDRKAALRTGRGMESVLNDGRCGRIIRTMIAPNMKQGDIDAAVVGAVTAVSEIVSDPKHADDLLSKYENDAQAAEKDNFFSTYLMLGLLAFIAMAACAVIVYARSSKLERHERYEKLRKLSLPYLVITVGFIGIPVLSYLLLRLLMRHARRGKAYCPNCGNRMRLVDEVHDNDYLTPAQDREENIGSVDYDVWHCDNCGTNLILPYINHEAKYSVCPSCGARAEVAEGNRILQQPTETAEGIGEKTFCCRNCNKRRRLRYLLPKVVAPTVIIPMGGIGGSHRGGGFGGGGFSGGSFGGGSTGGGGASGGW